MGVLVHLTLVALFLPGVVSQFFWRVPGAYSCGWRFGGQCKPACDRGEYILGTLPCAFGVLGTCCSPTLACSAYGGRCRNDGCLPRSEVEFTYKVRCPSSFQSCCLRKAKDVGPLVTVAPPPPTTPAPPAPVFPQRCTARPRSRILGGLAVRDPCQWPWMVSIRLGTPTSRGPHICAGVLVTNNKVLTTVGCVRGNTVFVTLSDRDITVNGEAEEVDIGVSASPVIHEGFNRTPGRTGLFANDLAIITLDSPIPFSSCADAVCLPRVGFRNPVATDFARCFVAGWGVNENGDGLQHEAIVRVLNNSVCTSGLSFSGIINLPPDKLCSLPLLDRTDACPGDNGGMLVCEDTPNTYSLYGLISDNACTQNLPVIYTDIVSHLDWIKRNL